MAKGYPDFYGFSIFPRYGAVMSDQVVALNVADDDRVELHALIGKGRITGGVLRILGALDFGWLWPEVWVDGVKLTYDMGPNATILNFGRDSRGFPLALKNYLGKSGTASWDYVNDYVFNETYSVWCNNESGAIVTVNSNLNYTLMQ